MQCRFQLSRQNKLTLKLKRIFLIETKNNVNKFFLEFYQNYYEATCFALFETEQKFKLKLR